MQDCKLNPARFLVIIIQCPVCIVRSKCNMEYTRFLLAARVRGETCLNNVWSIASERIDNRSSGP